MLGWFEDDDQRRRDREELIYLRSRYGRQINEVLRQRASDTTLSPRSRRHWKRLHRKAVRVTWKSDLRND